MDATTPEQDSFRWGRRDLIAFATFFIATVVFLPFIAFLILRAFQPNLQMKNFSTSQKIVIQAAMDLLWIAFIFFLAKGLHGQPILRTLRVVRTPVGLIVRFAIAGVLLGLLIALLSMFLPVSSRSVVEGAASLTLVVLFGGILGPILEEIVFRGFVFKVVEDAYDASLAVPVTTLLFAGLHLSQLGGSWAAFIVILILGYLLTVVRQRTGSLIPSIIMHTAYNSTILGLGALATMLGHAGRVS
jgi:membrane protease YdiL (CAAX protease family)